MKKSFLSVFALAVFGLVAMSTSFDNAAFEAGTVVSPVSPTVAMSLVEDGRNSVSGTISTNGTSASSGGSGSGTFSASVSSEGGTGSFSATTSTGSGGGTFTTTTTSGGGGGGFDICDYITSAYLRSLFGCD